MVPVVSTKQKVQGAAPFGGKSVVERSTTKNVIALEFLWELEPSRKHFQCLFQRSDLFIYTYILCCLLVYLYIDPFLSFFLPLQCLPFAAVPGTSFWSRGKARVNKGNRADNRACSKLQCRCRFMSGGYLKIVLGVKCPVQLLQLYSLSCLSLFGAIPSGHVPASSFFLDWRCKLRLPKCLTICEHVMFALHNGLGDGQKMRFFRVRDVCPSGVASPADQLPSLGMSGLRLHDFAALGLRNHRGRGLRRKLRTFASPLGLSVLLDFIGGRQVAAASLGRSLLLSRQQEEIISNEVTISSNPNNKLWTFFFWVRYGEMRSHETKIR